MRGSRREQRRVIKQDRDLEASREAKPAVRRHFGPGTVLNILQWVRRDIARFTIEGEGIEVWCCPQPVIDEQTDSPHGSMTAGPA
jgi:hypothetical protein